MSSSLSSISGKQLIITGGTRGIGAAITEAAARHGAKRIVVGYRSDAQAATKLISELSSNPETANTSIHAIGGELKDEASCKKFVEDARAQLEGGKIDGLVLSAGSMKMATLEQTTDSSFDDHFESNVKGTLFTIKAAVPHINDDGRIICFSTSVLASPQALGPGYLQYSMAKAAVEQLVKVLQRDPSIGGPEKRIGINAISPGATGTDLFYAGKTQETIDRIASIMPQKRLGKPEEVCTLRLVAFPVFTS